jgi:molybdenum cofactor biosynthesis protein B
MECTMAGIDQTIEFKPVHIGIMTISDTRTTHTDESGGLLESLALDAGHYVVERTIVVDDQDAIRLQLAFWIDHPDIQVVLSTGGTGITARDVTPEAFQSVFEKEIPGFGELFRMLSFKTIGTSTIQSRALAGVAGGTLLFALPGSPGACRDAWEGILSTQLDNRHRPCNFIEILPRLSET